MAEETSAGGGRYYWLKLKTDFFDSDEVKVLLAQENGAEYVLFWLRLLSKAIQQEEPGRLRLRETIPYTLPLLSSVLNTDIDIVRSAMKAFGDLGLVRVVEDGTIWVEAAKQMVGAETRWAQYKRVERGGRKLLDNVQALSKESVGQRPPELRVKRLETRSKDNDHPAAPSDRPLRRQKSAEGYSPDFLTAWASYPRKTEKLAAYKAWSATLKRKPMDGEPAATVDALLAAVKHYAAECRASGTELKFVKHGATFFGPSEPWRDHLAGSSQPLTREAAAAAAFGR